MFSRHFFVRELFRHTHKDQLCFRILHIYTTCYVTLVDIFIGDKKI